MLERFFEYLNNNYIKIDNGQKNKTCYALNKVPNSLNAYYKECSQNKKILWTPEKLDVISYKKGTNNKVIKANIREVKSFTNKKAFPYHIEKPGKKIIALFNEISELTLFRGSVKLTQNINEGVYCVKPSDLKGKFYIGNYAGITPVSCPVFMDCKGKIFVYDYKTFKNVPKNNTEEEIDKYKQQSSLMLKSWDNINDFLIEECERLKKIFIKTPSIYAIEKCEPRK